MYQLLLLAEKKHDTYTTQFSSKDGELLGETFRISYILPI